LFRITIRTALLPFVVKLLSSPVGMSGEPDRETATALFRLQVLGFRKLLRPLTGRLDPSSLLAGRRGVTSATASAPVFFYLLCIASPSFPEAFTAYGMATVLPPVVAVKR
jgi:hypothetical protein